jgi:predicted RecB family nuclease
MTKLLSASRLNNFLGCAHHAALWLEGVEPPLEDNASLDLVRRKGFEHEAAVLARLEAQHGSAVSIADDGAVEARIADTMAAIAGGAALIYQGAFANERWIGFPDFLIRTGSQAGNAVLYEPEDAKLARSAKAEHVLQLGIYGSLLREATGIPIGAGVIHVGAGEPAAFDLRRTEHITARLMRKFEAFADLPERQTRAVRCAACAQCPFQSRCQAEWRAADSPVFVAGLRGDQMIKLEAAGITTLTALAQLDPVADVPGLSRETLGKLIQQARLQRNAAERGDHEVELLPIERGRGFALLPEPQPGDLFFDMEGDPLYPEGLEYLFGLWGPLGPNGEDVFHPIWAHDHDAEKAAFVALIELFVDHLARYPDAHIYHYAPYETAALKRLAMRDAVMEAELDQLLREHRFVDLYQVVRQSVRASTEGYSLKDLEKIYWGKRDGEVTNAADSIVEYERWRETSDPEILAAIGRYNKDDVVSTAAMRDWLERQRPPGDDYALEVVEPDAAAQARAEKREAQEEDRLALASAVRASDQLDDGDRDLIAELLWFHQRSQKPQFWALYDRQTWSDDELAEDIESLGGLTLDPTRPAYKDKQSLVAAFRFEPQDTKLKEGDPCKIALTLQAAGTIVELDTDDGRVVLRRQTKAGDFPVACSLTPGRLVNQGVLVDGVAAFARRFASGDGETDRALLDLIAKRHPRLGGRAPGDPILETGAPLLDGSIAAIRALQNSYLAVQGPPGTGKTFATSHAILQLLQAGKRVAVSSNSHKAINNLLTEVECRAKAARFSFQGAKRASQGHADSVHHGPFVKPAFDKGGITRHDQLVGGTAFHFALPEELGAYDYLFVEEAGQVSLGNLVAMGGCAKNIVLVGDQMQLPQPVQGVHPGQSGLSCLDYLMGDHATVPPDRGILLDLSWRMHPAVCRFISEAFYDGRLKSHATAATRGLILREDAAPILRSAGLRVLEVDHRGCTQTSTEEAAAIDGLIRSLLEQSVRLETGEVRPMRLDDILVVAPFNAQVNLLRKRLPAGVKVGTVDKFQGQEAIVSIVSMTTSDGAEAPRGTEFLFSANRLNVAVSRAKCLAVVVRSARLLELSPTSIDALKRLDAFARADVDAGGQTCAWGEQREDAGAQVV